jgi:hypothetical protein
VISFSFPCLKEKLCGRRFLSAEEIVAATSKAIWDLPANSFQQCFQQLYQGWQTCMAANGDCFEGECEYVSSVCEYLLIWCDKTTVHKIIDCSSIAAKAYVYGSDG